MAMGLSRLPGPMGICRAGRLAPQKFCLVLRMKLSTTMSSQLGGMRLFSHSVGRSGSLLVSESSDAHFHQAADRLELVAANATLVGAF